MRDLNPERSRTMCRRFRSRAAAAVRISPDSKELAFTENPDPVPAISTSAQIFTLDLTDPAAKPVKIIDFARAATSIRLIRPMESTWRGGRRRGPGMRAISFG